MMVAPLASAWRASSATVASPAVGYPAVAVDPIYVILLVGGVDPSETVSTGIALFAAGDAG